MPTSQSFKILLVYLCKHSQHSENDSSLSCGLYYIVYEGPCLFFFNLLGSPIPFIMTFTCLGDDKYLCLRPFMIGCLSFHDMSRLTVTQSYKVALLTKSLCGKSVRINSQQYVLVLVSFCLYTHI